MKENKRNEDYEKLALDSKLAAWDIIIKQVIDKTSQDDTEINKKNLAVVLASLNAVVLEGYLSYMPGSEVAQIYYFIADNIATAEPGKELEAIMEASMKRKNPFI